ncbi:MAG: ROK family protein, partial [Verrucomicrobiae bacterium]|nr:ROK family protein [Verrucomicrobiae bacterium]
IVERARMDTRTPAETFPEMAAFFASHAPLAGIGIASFGPIDIDPASPSYGTFTTTPKPGWSGARFHDALAGLGTPILVDTDVNGAALGELEWGAARGLSSVVYLTVGTGIGGGIVADGNPIHGVLHPEVGHMRLPRTEEDRAAFAGGCPFHGDCLEGLASGPAIQKRWGLPAEELPDDHEAWEHVTDAMAWACVNLACVVSPQRIIIGGGVYQRETLFPRLRAQVAARLNGYIDVPEIIEGMDGYIVPPGLGQDAGLFGAMALGRRVFDPK